MVAVLMVDNDPSIRNALRREIHASSLDLFEASNVPEAYRWMRRYPLKVLITELILPEHDGLELICASKWQLPSLKIIALSHGGWMSPEPHLAFARGLGADRVLSKPVSIPLLVHTIKTLVNERVALF